MFLREMYIRKNDIDTIDDVKCLEKICKRYIELDEMIFGRFANDYGFIRRTYQLNPKIQKDSFSIDVAIRIENDDVYSDCIFIGYNEPIFKKIEMAVEIPKDVSTNILYEFCNLHKNLFGVPARFDHYEDEQKSSHNKIIFNPLREKSQN